MDSVSEEDGLRAIEQARSMSTVLSAIDRLLDAIETLEAPITRELLRTAMMALVQECKLEDPIARVVH